MTTTIDTTEIRFNRDSKDYDITDRGEYVASAANYFEAEQKRTAYLASRTADGIVYEYASASELDSDPFADPRTDEEKQWETEGWTEVDGGWEKFGPHPFDPSKTVRHFRKRLFDPTPLPEPDDIPGADPAPKRCPLDEANRLAALYLLSRGIDACTICGLSHRPTQCPDVAAERQTQVDTLPNPGRAIYRQWHRDPQRFLRALRELDPVCWWVLAEAYAAYRHMSVQQTLDCWLISVQGTQHIPSNYKNDLVLEEAI